MMTQTSSDIQSDLSLAAYDYYLPAERIADRPAPGRDSSRLMVYAEEGEEVADASFSQLADFLPENSLLVLNQTKVFPCRLLGHKNTGGKCEVFILSVIPSNNTYRALIRTGGKKHLGDQYLFEHGLKAKIAAINENGTFQVEFNAKDVTAVLEEAGRIPIPPYIRSGESDEQDKKDYQTVYAKDTGSVAAPTAGLHFTDEVFQKLEEKNIEIAYVTLHVGLGTFAPVKAETITDHHMHSEDYFVTQENLDKLNRARANGKKVFAVGTTTLRVLESSFGKELEADRVYSTDIFIHPGKEVRSIDGLITNFHLPKSSLLMLVSAIIGREKLLQLYHQAIENKYRFFSYGDAMLILRGEK